MAAIQADAAANIAFPMGFALPSNHINFEQPPFSATRNVSSHITPVTSVNSSLTFGGVSHQPPASGVSGLQSPAQLLIQRLRQQSSSQNPSTPFLLPRGGAVVTPSPTETPVAKRIKLAGSGSHPGALEYPSPFDWSPYLYYTNSQSTPYAAFKHVCAFILILKL